VKGLVKGKALLQKSKRDTPKIKDVRKKHGGGGDQKDETAKNLLFRIMNRDGPREKQ